MADGSPATVWKSAERALLSGDASTLELLLREHELLFREQRPPAYGPEPGRLAPDYSRGDARAIITRNHHFDSWTEFTEYAEALTRANSPVALFEAAVDAVVSGDVSTLFTARGAPPPLALARRLRASLEPQALERLLREHPNLIRARSTRKHHSTLLHYVGANGVEAFRQKTPPNAVTVLKVLLAAGADVDAAADMYGGGSTTLGLVATSIHPLLAGVQDALMETLLDAGAAIGGPDAVNGCLANGRPQAAEFLAGRGAPLDLEGAAGVGRLDVVTSFFDEDGRVMPNATHAQMLDGFAWACEYGRTAVVDFLLQKGLHMDARLKHNGQTGLHWAAYGGHLETARLLLERKAAVDAKDESFGGTPLGWALYGWGEQSNEDTRARYYDVVALLVAAGATVEPEWLDENDRGFPLDKMIQADPRMLAALGRQDA